MVDKFVYPFCMYIGSENMNNNDYIANTPSSAEHDVTQNPVIYLSTAFLSQPEEAT